MGERKVLNKYIPPDFDPRLVPRTKRPKDDLVPVRMMLPFSIQCSTCSSFMYRGRKFNSKKEPMGGGDGTYLGIKRFRFYIKCTVCSRPITFLTDPKNSDYEMESGATRNYEIWQDREKTEEEGEKERVEEEKSDPMKALENRVLDSQREMADLDNLDEIKAMNMKHLQMMSGGSEVTGGFNTGVNAVLTARKKNHEVPEKVEELNENGLTSSEEALVKKIKFGSSEKCESAAAGIRRLGEEEEKILDSKRRAIEAKLEQQQAQILENKNAHCVTIMPVVKIKRKRAVVNEVVKKSKVLAPDAEQKDKCKDFQAVSDDDSCKGLGGLLGAYASDSD